MNAADVSCLFKWVGVDGRNSTLQVCAGFESFLFLQVQMILLFHQCLVRELSYMNNLSTYHECVHSWSIFFSFFVVYLDDSALLMSDLHIFTSLAFTKVNMWFFFYL